MSEGVRIKLAAAQKIAERIRDELAGYCDRIDIAGSVRRQRPECGDIDLVLLPKEGQRRDIEKRMGHNPNTRVLRSGPEIMALILANGVQVDLYFARPAVNDLAGYIPGNYGMRLLAMTGSREHNVMLARLAKQRGYHFAPYRGLLRGGFYQAKGEGEEYVGGEVFAAEEELNIFRELGQGWIAPEAREVQA
ncbi:MAG TPA: hypothetical protein VG838_00595 [Opitutaceae bacterium]|nr:hypothetical protein [Opitutaceae bacterium]